MLHRNKQESGHINMCYSLHSLLYGMEHLKVNVSHSLQGDKITLYQNVNGITQKKRAF